MLKLNCVKKPQLLTNLVIGKVKVSMQAYLS